MSSSSTKEAKNEEVKPLEVPEALKRMRTIYSNHLYNLNCEKEGVCWLHRKKTELLEEVERLNRTLLLCDDYSAFTPAKAILVAKTQIDMVEILINMIDKQGWRKAKDFCENYSGNRFHRNFKPTPLEDLNAEIGAAREAICDRFKWMVLSVHDSAHEKFQKDIEAQDENFLVAIGAKEPRVPL